MSNCKTIWIVTILFIPASIVAANNNNALSGDTEMHDFLSDLLPSAGSSDNDQLISPGMPALLFSNARLAQNMEREVIRNLLVTACRNSDKAVLTPSSQILWPSNNLSLKDLLKAYDSIANKYKGYGHTFMNKIIGHFRSSPSIVLTGIGSCTT